MNNFTTGVVGLTTVTLSVLSVKKLNGNANIDQPIYINARTENHHSSHSHQESESAARDTRIMKVPVYGIIDMKQTREIPRAVGLPTWGIKFLDL